MNRAFGLRLSRFEGDHVKSTAPVFNLTVSLQVVLRCQNNAFLFPFVDRVGGAAEALMAAGAYLDENQYIPLSCNDIDLTRPRAVVAFEDGKTVALQQFDQPDQTSV